MQAAVAYERRAPSLAAVEEAYVVFQIKRDVSKANLRWYERLVFHCIWIPFMRFCTTYLHLPLVEDMKNGCWTEKEGIVTTREAAVEACKGHDPNYSTWYFHRLKVNTSMSGETARARSDHDFPGAGTRAYRKVSSDVAEVNRSEVERVACLAKQVSERAKLAVQ